MQLLVHITNHENVVDPIMIKLAKAGFHGASVVDCEGMLKSLNQDSVDAPTIFGGLRQFVNPGRQQNKMILVVLKDEEIQSAIDIIHSVSGDMKLPNGKCLKTNYEYIVLFSFSDACWLAYDTYYTFSKASKCHCIFDCRCIDRTLCI